jgi:multidrug efflux pump
MRVWLDPLHMAAHGLTTQDIEAALRRENAEIPGGRVEGREREFAVRTRGELTTPEEFGAIIVSRNQDDIVRLRDVAEVIGAETSTVALQWKRRSRAGDRKAIHDTVGLAAEVREALENLAASSRHELDVI